MRVFLFHGCSVAHCLVWLGHFGAPEQSDEVRAGDELSIQHPMSWRVDDDKPAEDNYSQGPFDIGGFYAAP